MAVDEKVRFIQYLVDKVNTYEFDKRATELAVEKCQSTFDSVSVSLESLKKKGRRARLNCARNVLSARRPRP